MGQVLQSHITTAIQAKQVQASRIATQKQQIYTQTGEVTIYGVGTASEATAVVTFPNVFIEKPTFTYGWELAPNQGATQGSFPVGTAFILQWTNPTTTTPYLAYTGATIATVTSGVDGQQLILHYSFTGRALAYPASASPINSTGNA
jgi:hypothetical protein